MIAEDHDDPRVIEAVEEYLSALETGQPPDLQTFLQRHADIAGPLKECLAGLQMVHAATPSLHVDRAAAPLQGEPLGDFRLIREIGRGGMGVVYEAMQLSLGRRVALKVLPFAAALDPRQLQRFKNEAQAAALLHHPNIVPVYAVGCERGVHYYAMQFIDGRSLSCLSPLTAVDEDEQVGPTTAYRLPGVLTPLQSSSRIKGKETAIVGRSTQRDPGRKEVIRSVATLSIKAARALDHAHQLGIVHRDVKPANLLLDRDGCLWVTDFGLAMMQSDANLTRSGELLGTLRYMSPEQALSKPALVDHRTDVYSLGATLYELLTRRPVFGGSDRQELLRQIAFEEPAPPRRLDPSIPHELETVVIKALAKTPAERYSSAGELADDLQRYLDDQPILARRPTLLERASKWSRRHRGFVFATVALLLILVAGLGVSTLMIARAYESERGQAAEARRQRAEAEESFQRARQAVDFFVKISEEELADKFFMQSVRRKMLEAALIYYQDFIAQRADDPALQKELATTKERVARIIEDLITLQGRHDLHLLNVRDVQELLKLDEVQRNSLGEMDGKLALWRKEDFQDFRKLSLDQRHQRMVEEARRQEQMVAKILTLEQSHRLKQIALQQRGPTAFLDSTVADALKLTTKQRESIRKLIDENGPFMRMMLSGPKRGERGEPRPPLSTLFRDTMNQILEQLSEPQRTKWREMTGEPVNVPFRPAPPEGLVLPTGPPA